MENLRILMAEDEPDTARLYRDLLESSGYIVDLVFNGQECVNLYLKEVEKTRQQNKILGRSKPYDVVLLDHVMPILDGLEASKEISQVNPEQRIVFLTAYVNETLLAAINDLGKVVELIRKPFEPDVLLKLLEDMTPSSKLAELSNFAKSIFRAKNIGVNDSRVSELIDLLRKIQTPGSI